MTNLKRFPVFFITFLLAHLAAAQVTFNYDQITICEGDSYDLLAYQTNEVIVPVDWELIGWKDVSNTTVMPTVSPTVYTLEYREKANPGVVLTKDLTVSLRPKPTVSITPNGTQSICEGAPIHIEKVSAANYDDLYWICVQTGDKYYTEHLDAIATTAYTDRKQTYKLIATNNECAVLAQSQMEYEVLTASDIPSSAADIGWWGTAMKLDGLSLGIPYCESPVYLADYINLYNVQFSVHGQYVSLYPNPDPANSYEASEDELAKIVSYSLVYDQEDQYTAGAPLTSGSLSKSFTVSIEIYFKTCGITKTYSRKYTANFGEICEPTFSLSANCTYPYMRFYGGAVPNTLNKIISVEVKNLTLPGQYEAHIPNGYNISNSSSSKNYNYSIEFDQNVPPTMDYEITITYEALNGITKTFTHPQTVYFCKDVIIDYNVATKDSYNGLFYLHLLRRQTSLPERGWNSDWRQSYPGPPDRIEATVCKGEKAYITLTSQLKEDMEIVWDNANPVPVAQNGSVRTDYVSSTGSDGKTAMTISPITVNGNPPAYAGIFEFSPEETTVYTGTLFGLAFEYKVTVVDNRLAVQDTAICRGNSIDLKTLEIEENISGGVTWNVSNTVVSPLVDTEYLVYGIANNRCPQDTDYTLTQKIMVYVDSPLWSTSAGQMASCENDLIDLADAIHSNARDMKWSDGNAQSLPDGIVTVNGDATYTVEISNACGTTTETVNVKVTDECLTYDFAKSDTLVYKGCFGTWPGQQFLYMALDDSEFPCEDPVVTILTQPENQNTTAIYDILNRQFSYQFSSDSKAMLDSIQYEVSCGFKKATAWAYFELKEATQVEISNIEVTPTEIKVEITGGNYDEMFYLVAIGGENATLQEIYLNDPLNPLPLNIVGNTLYYTFSNGSALEDGDYQIVFSGVAMCLDWEIITIKDGEIFIPPCTPPAITIAETIVCQNEDITVNLTGVAPFTLDYTFNGARETVTIAGTSETFTATQAGANQFIVHSLTSDDGCVLSDSTIPITVNPTYNQTESVIICAGQLPYTWRDITFPLGTVSDNYVYNRKTQHNCDSIVTVQLTVHQIDYDTKDASICEGESYDLWASITYLQNTQIKFYDSGGVELPSPVVSPAITTTYYVKADNPAGCQLDKTIQVTVTNKPTVGTISAISTICEGAKLNLIPPTVTDGDVQMWLLDGNPFDENMTVSYENNNQILQYIAENNCGTASSETVLYVEKSPELDTVEYEVCAGNGVELQAPASDAYLWLPVMSNEQNPVVTPTETTVYTLRLTNNTCTFDYSVKVNVLPLPQPVIVRQTGIDEVKIFADKPYEYRLNNGAFSPETVFHSLPLGNYLLKIRNAEGCETQQEFAVVSLYIPPYFSPNDDGREDEWEVIGLSNFAEAEVYIYDRTGKLLEILNADRPAWNGRYNGRSMPSTDYWYLLEVPEFRETKTGHFTLKR